MSHRTLTCCSPHALHEFPSGLGLAGFEGGKFCPARFGGFARECAAVERIGKQKFAVTGKVRFALERPALHEHFLVSQAARLFNPGARITPAHMGVRLAGRGQQQDSNDKKYSHTDSISKNTAISYKTTVVPAQAGIQCHQRKSLCSRLRGNDTIQKPVPVYHRASDRNHSKEPKMLRHAFIAALSVLSLTLFSPNLFAQAPYPAKPIKIVIGFPPGGATDILSRDFAAKLADELKQQVIIDNKPGAGGTIGADQVAKSAPDGYTLTIGTTSNHAIAVSLYKKLAYDPVNDFAPITMLAVSQNVVVINPAIPVSTIQELVAHAKANPGALNYGSSGNGTISHFTGELFNALNSTQIQHIPYKGSAFVFPDLFAGRVSMMFDSTISISPHIKAGKVKALAVTGAKRSKLMPDLPTVAESGYPGFESTNFFGLFAPANTPKDIIARLHAASVKVLAQPDLVERFANQGAEVVANRPEEALAMLKADIAKWSEVAKKSGAKID